MYAFPKRPFPDVFPINIAFTLLVLPALSAGFIQITNYLRPFARVLFTLMVGLVISLIEPAAEKWGYFTHNAGWDHAYSFFGYTVFLFLVVRIYRWLS